MQEDPPASPSRNNESIFGWSVSAIADYFPSLWHECLRTCCHWYKASQYRTVHSRRSDDISNYRDDKVYIPTHTRCLERWSWYKMILPLVLFRNDMQIALQCRVNRWFIPTCVRWHYICRHSENPPKQFKYKQQYYWLYDWSMSFGNILHLFLIKTDLSLHIEKEC